MMLTSQEPSGDYLLALYKSRDFQSEAAQIQAKALLTEISERLPSYNWTYIAHRVVRNLALAMLDVVNLSEIAPDNSADVAIAARKFALVWESLAKLGESTSSETALLNAAINYELAGYQANAMAIAKQLGRTENRSRLALLGRFFLQRRFHQLRGRAIETLVEPRGDMSELNVAERVALGLAGRAFAEALPFFLSGTESGLERAFQTFIYSEQVYASLGLVEDANLVRNLASLLPTMKARSTWTLLSPYITDPQGVSKWQRYLRLLGRGITPDVANAASISELWPSQIIALQNGLLDSESSKVIKMPTSAGKTRIAEMAIVHALVSNPGAKCIYIAPFRALVAELEQNFLNILSDLGYRVSTITGTFESDDFQDLLFRETDVLITTPEKLDLLLRTQPEFLANTLLFVLDEAQIIADRDRGPKFEFLINRLMRRLPGARFLMLSAVVPDQTLEDFAQWFNSSSERDIIRSTWRPSVQRYAKFEWSGDSGILRYAPENDIQVLREFVPGVISQQRFEYINPETGYRKHPQFPEKTNKAQIAAELALKFAELGPVLVFCPQTNLVEAVAKALQERLRLAALTGETVPAYFSRNTGLRSAALAEDWLGERAITAWLRSGIGVHYGSLPDVLRTAIETDFRQRNLRVLIATNTLAQGVNLPVKTVIFHSCWRFQETRKRITARDYWNIAGRAGRAGEETEGLIVHIKTTPADDIDFRYFLSHRDNVEPVESALFQQLLELTQQRLSEEALAAELDPEILALLAEEGQELLLEGGIEEVLGRTLTHHQASRRGYSLQGLTKVIRSAMSGIAQRIEDPELRVVYSSTGLSSTSCAMLHTHIAEHKSELRELITSDLEGTSVQALLELLLPICLSLPEMETRRELASNYGDLLSDWIKGVEMGALIREYGQQPLEPEEFGKLVDELFRYLLPWGFSAYMRIALHDLTLTREETSNTVKFLPSMVKFGLPYPAACWAMSIGIPFRKTAIQIAAAFLSESDSPGYEPFLEWLNTLSTDRLLFDFDIRPPLLEDVSRAILRSASNYALRTYTTIAEFLPIDTIVQGIEYQDRLGTALQVRIGETVTIERNYDNIIDRNAISVKLRGAELGYLAREVAQVLAPEIDAGVVMQGTIITIRKRFVPEITVRIFQRPN
jgi:helicase